MGIYVHIDKNGGGLVRMASFAFLLNEEGGTHMALSAGSPTNCTKYCLLMMPVDFCPNTLLILWYPSVSEETDSFRMSLGST